MLCRRCRSLPRPSSGRVFPCALVVALVVALMMSQTPAGRATGTPGPRARSSGTDAVVVRTIPGATGPVLRSVRAGGGTVTKPLPLIDGFAARLPVSEVARLRLDRRVVAVVPDGPVQVQGGGAKATPPSDYLKEVRAARTQRLGWKGAGVTVALVDTGVAPVPDLAGRVVQVVDDHTGLVTPCENLSGEADCDDGYGHGTFMAGIIAGDGGSSAGRWRGVAPDARILSVKVAGRDGSADVSTVLAAIQWVVSFRGRYQIGVLNLSLGTDSTQSTRVDPLNYAVERAWQAGITVVVAASNRGPAPSTISKPGDDPWVITVGAVDDRGTPTVADDQLPLFSGRGPTAGDGWAKPDLVAPGAHVVSLRAPGSVIDQQFPSSLHGAYREGSGTSMAAAVVSGVAALVLGAHSRLSPDRIKHILTAVARPAASVNPDDVGAGVVDAYAAVVAPPAGRANGGAPRSSGLGGLDASRGGVRVATDGLPSVVISGLLTAQDILWDPVGFVTGDWSAATWYLSLWYLFPWRQVDWYGSNWEGSNWEGSQWYGSFDGSSRYGRGWKGNAWYGAWE